MIEWWNRLSLRERALVGAAAALLALIVLLQFILFPLLANRAAASLRAEQASRTLDLMTSRGLSATSAASSSSGAALDADARRLAIARVQVSAEGVVTVQVDDTNAENVFAWLFELRSSAGLEASKATITQAGAGLVRSSFEFGGMSAG